MNGHDPDKAPTTQTTGKARAAYPLRGGLQWVPHLTDARRGRRILGMRHGANEGLLKEEIHVRGAGAADGEPD